MNTRRHAFLLPLTVLALASCATQSASVAYSVPDSTWTATFPVSWGTNLLIPMGSTAAPTFSTEVLVGGHPYDYGVEPDGFGNSWATVARSDIGGSVDLTVRYTVTGRDPAWYRAVATEETDWLSSTRYIDWQDPAILAIAKDLALDGVERAVATRRIGEYVVEHVAYDEFPGRHPASAPASETLAKGSGICINRARVFVSLCRASGIPARTVSGAVRHHADPTRYEFHHEWMEYLDEEGYWHGVDLRYTESYNLNDTRYAGFVYGAEDHPWFADIDNRNLESGQPVQLHGGDVVLFHYHPIFDGARYGFSLTGRGDAGAYVIEKTMTVTSSGRSLVIEQRPTG